MRVKGLGLRVQVLGFLRVRGGNLQLLPHRLHLALRGWRGLRVEAVEG